MAGAACLSRHHFARSFRACFGETPGAYMSRRRVERAQDLLRSANLTVTEICLMVGFQSLGSFSSRFRDLVGCSPTAYRDRHVAAHGGPPIPGCILMAWTCPGAGAAGRSGAGSAGGAGAGAGLGPPTPVPPTPVPPRRCREQQSGRRPARSRPRSLVRSQSDIGGSP